MKKECTREPLLEDQRNISKVFMVGHSRQRPFAERRLRMRKVVTTEKTAFYNSKTVIHRHDIDHR